LAHCLPKRVTIESDLSHYRTLDKLREYMRVYKVYTGKGNPTKQPPPSKTPIPGVALIVYLIRRNSDLIDPRFMCYSKKSTNLAAVKLIKITLHTTVCLVMSLLALSVLLSDRVRLSHSPRNRSSSASSTDVFGPPSD
jgi:hypothetical protein